jgi:hypothetical protein
VELRCGCRSWLGHDGIREGSEVMTEDRDFKDLVRQRAEKTGESYQTARRQLEKQAAFSARLEAIFYTRSGIAFGCIVEDGRVSRGMRVTVAGHGITHHATVASLRRSWRDVDSVVADESADRKFGMIVEPPYAGPLPAHVTG